MPTKTRTSLKDTFKTGAVPTAGDFADLIDSAFNTTDDTLNTLLNNGALTISVPAAIATIPDETLIQFQRTETTNLKTPTWKIQQKEGTNAGFSIRDNASNSSRLFISSTGNLGIGTVTPGAKLTVQGDATIGVANNKLTVNGAIVPGVGNLDTAGISFPANAFGGVGDGAWLRYYARTGTVESATLELGIGNDSDDHIALMSSGNVGIGTLAPTSKLTVNGDTSVSGYVMSQKVYFSAYAYRYDPSINPTTFNTPFAGAAASDVVQNSGAYSPATGIFTAPVSGVYLFTFGGLRSDNVVGSLYWYLIVKYLSDPNKQYANKVGPATEDGESAAIFFSATQTSIFKTMIVKLNKNETAEIWQKGTAGTFMDNYRSSFEGILISAGV